MKVKQFLKGVTRGKPVIEFIEMHQYASDKIRREMLDLLVIDMVNKSDACGYQK